MQRSRLARPHWLRRAALLNACVFVWSFLLFTPTYALTHPPQTKRLGLRSLTTQEMGHLWGRVSSVPPASGAAYRWQATHHETNTGNGNKLTSHSIVAWTARGGLPVNLTLYHNSQGSTNAELGQKWTHSFKIWVSPSGFDMIVHWGNGQDVRFAGDGCGNYFPPTGIHDTLTLTNGMTLTKPDQTKYHFVLSGTNRYCDSISDENGNTITIAYNASNQVTTVTDPTNRVLSLGYTNGKVSTITDPLNRQWSLSYDANGNLQTVSNPPLSGVTYSTTYSYDASHNITDLQTPRGTHWTFSYNVDGSLAWEKDPALNQTSYTYASTTTTVTDPNGKQTVYTYDTSGRVTQVKDPLLSHEDYTWDANNNRTKVTDKRGFAWQYTYDSMGNMLTKKDPYLNTWTYTYNGHNFPLTITDPLTHKTTLAYDNKDNLTSVTDANNHQTTYTYDVNGLRQTETDALTHQTSYGYNANGDLTSLTDPLTHQTTFAYNTLGWRTSVTDANTNVTSFGYDNWGRLTTVTTPAGTTTTAYDPNSNVTSVTDANNHATTNVYDSSDRLTSSTKANGDAVTYTHDGVGQKGLLSSKTDGNTHTTSYTYTARNELASASYPDNTSESWTYNANGDLASHTDGKGNLITYTYDNASRKTGITYPVSPNVSFTYDTANRLTGMTDATGTTGYSYDAGNRLTQIAAPNGTLNYTYDAVDRRTQMSLVNTGTWTYSYDNADRLTGLTNPYTESTSYTYDAGNRLTQQTNANSTVTTYSYDTANRITDVWHKQSGGTVLGHYAYEYDSVGNLTQRTDPDSTLTTFGYDAADQVTSEVRGGTGGYSISYTYDHNGNRLSKTQGGVTTNYSYDAHDKLLSVGSKTYSYDNNGNCTSVTSGGQTTSLTYDYENRVTGITYPGGATNSFSYNGLGLRTRKVDSTGTYNYVCDGTEVASPVLKDGAATYTPGLSERRGTVSKFYHADALGSTRGITDSTQTATDSLLYDAFGMVVSRTGTTPTPFGFVGKAQYQTDNDSGLMLLGHRYYDASVGRFISQDSARHGDNWYAYCENNPLSRTDASGLSWRSILIGALAGIATTVVTGNPIAGVAVGVGVGTAVSHWGEGNGWGDSFGDGCAAGLVVGELGPIAVGAAGAIGFRNCFVAGTPVMMADGSTKPIEQVKPGDWVLSHSPENKTSSNGGKTGASSSANRDVVAKKVVRTFVRDQAKTLALHLAGGETIQTTPGHPFFVEGKGFVLAGHLAVGNAIVTRAGPAVRIVGVEQRTEATVYNFEVEGTHTYFVGTTNGGLWVHNVSAVGGGGAPAPADFVGYPDGTAIPTSRTRLEDGFRNAGFPSYPNARTPEPGTNYIDPSNGNIYRVMQGSAVHPPRLITHAPAGNPLLPNGSNIPPGVRGNAVRDLTHFPLQP